MALHKILSLLLFHFLSSYPTFAQTTDNAELQKMYDEDQHSRSVPNIDWRTLTRQDSLRELRVYEMIKAGKIVTAKDYANSAMIFQHGRDTVASSMAVKHMRKAMDLDSTMNKWLLAAAIDRDLMRRGKPQIYGTQYVKEMGEDKWKRYKIDSMKVSDEERKEYGVETLAEQKIRERELNMRSLSDYYAEKKSIESALKLINSEFKRGIKAEYNVSEVGLLMFGDELMNTNKMEDARKVLKLNTELYPEGYKAFHIYGDCLLKLDRKKEAIKAYEKSLKLNPKNSSAEKILKELKK